MNVNRGKYNQYRLNYLLALLGIAAGSSAAHLLIPDIDYYSPGALAVPAAMLSLGLMVGPTASALRHSASLLRPEPVLILGLVYWILIDAIQGSHGLWGTSRIAIHRAFLGIALFAGTLWIGSLLAHLIRGPKSEIYFPKLTLEYVFALVILTFLAGIFKPIVACNLNPQCIMDAFFLPYDELPWKQLNFGQFDTLVKYVGFLGFTTLPLAIVLLHLEGRASQRVILSMILGYILLLLFAQNGSRRLAGMVIAASSLVWVLLQPFVRTRHLVALAVISIATLYLLETMVTWRNEGLAAAILAEDEKDKKGKGVITIDKNLYYMTHAMSIVPERYPFKPIDGPLSALGAPIPRSIWPDKPTQGGGIPLLQHIGERKGPGFSWSCSAVCDLYLYGGFPSIAIGGLIFGILAQLASRLLVGSNSASRRLIYSFALMSLFIGLRNLRDLTAIGVIVCIVWIILYARRLYIRRSLHYEESSP